ncbi:MAG: hypothetical protein ABI986_13350, partial [Chloroflexota bacterium]
MTNNSKPKLPIQIIFAVILLIATIIIVLTALPRILKLKPSPTATQLSTATLLTQPLSKSFAIPTNTANPTLTSTITPTDTSAPTFAPTLTPTRTPIPRPLPDLTVTGISDPVCIHDFRPDTQKAYVKLTIHVRNIGRGSTKYYGPFNVRINLVLGQRHYSL